MAWQDSHTAEYYLSHMHKSLPFLEEQAETIRQILRLTSASVDSFLDLGCGDGWLADQILLAYPLADVVLLDFNDEMLRHAALRFQDRRHQITLVKADFGKDGWMDALGRSSTFDLIVSSFAVHHQSDDKKKRLYGQLLQLLKPEGWLFNIEHVSSSTPNLQRIWDESLVERLVADSNPIDSEDNVRQKFMEREDRAENCLSSVDEQCQWLRELGFTDVDCYFKYLQFAVFGGVKPHREAIVASRSEK